MMASQESSMRNCSDCSRNFINPTPLPGSDYESSDNKRRSWEFHDSIFSTVLLDGLNSMRAQNLLCDVVFISGSNEHRAHRAVLAAVSPFFKAMFSANLRESGQTNIPFHDIDSCVLEAILNFVYTSEIVITDNNVEDILVAADFIQLNSLRNLCCQYLQAQMNTSNCIGIYLIAKARNCNGLAYTAKRFTLEHFRNVIQEEEYLQLPYNELKDFLESSLLNISGEGEILETIIRWIEYSPGKRCQHLSSLLSEIDIWQVPAEKLLKFLNSEIIFSKFNKLQDTSHSSEMVTSDQMLGGDLRMAVEKVLFQRFDSSLVPSNHLVNSPFHTKKTRHSYEQELMLALGGEMYGYSMVSAQSMECFTLGYHGWKNIIPKAVALSGGISRYKLTASCECYSVQDNKWFPLPCFPVAIHGSAAALPNHTLCVVGGKTNELGIEKRAWALSERSNSWEPLPSMQYHRVHHGVASLNHMLYAVGGVGGRQVADENFLSSVECYDPFLNRWIPVAPMHEPRAYCGLVSVGSYLYAIGGYNDTSWLRSVERFDPLTNQWTMLTPMSTARSAFGATVWNGRIYVTGGNGTSHALNTAEKFNPRTNTWHCAQSISNGRVGLATVTVKIPLKME